MSKLSRMNTLANKLADRKFEYGKLDCYLFTARLVKEWHGEDFTTLHKVYKNQAEAEKYIHDNGGIEALTTGTLGYPRKSLDLAEDGDVASAFVGDDLALGFVFNDEALFKSKKGLLKMPIEDCRMVWRVK